MLQRFTLTRTITGPIVLSEISCDISREEFEEARAYIDARDRNQQAADRVPLDFETFSVGDGERSQIGLAGV